MRTAVIIALIVMLSIGAPSAAESSGRINISGKNYKSAECENSESVYPELPHAAMRYLRVVCVRQSQVVIANSPWVIRIPGSEQFSILPFSSTGKIEKNTAFTKISAREVLAEDAKAEFLSHYKHLDVIGGGPGAIPGTSPIDVKAMTETFLAGRSIGEQSVIVEFIGQNDLSHELYLFVNGEKQFSGGIISQFETAHGKATTKGTMTVFDPN